MLGEERYKYLCFQSYPMICIQQFVDDMLYIERCNTYV